MMQTYWDYTQKERAAMSREEVSRFLDGELMTKGVLKVEEPRLDDVPEVPQPKGQTFFTVEWSDGKYYGRADGSGFLFRTTEDAQAFAELHPSRLKEDWQSKLKHAEPLGNAKIAPVEILSEADYLAIQSTAKSAETVKDANKRKRDEYAQASAKTREVTDAIWQDWSNCLDKEAEHKKVLDTFDEYMRIAGDEHTAFTFLRKAFDVDDIREAFEWMERDCPDLSAVAEEGSA